MKYKMTIFWIALAAVFTGCQTMPYQGQARDVKKRNGQGGVIAIPINPRNEDRQVAEEKMRSNCGTRTVQVNEEGEVVTGTKATQNNRSTNRDDTRRNEGTFLGMNVISGDASGVDSKTETMTEAVKEWQLSYECVSLKGNKVVR